MAIAYQTAGFAYQGTGLFAYQGDAGGAAPTVTTKTGGKGDNERGKANVRKYLPFKPTGLIDRPVLRKPVLREPVTAKQNLENIQPPQSADGAIVLDDVALKVELRSSEILATLDTAQMRSAEIDAEIGRPLKLKISNDDEDIMLMALLAASL